jgi:predicted branched-subunit amino acid permease
LFVIPTESRAAFACGFRAMAAPSVAIATWGLVTGIAMAKALSVPQALGMSLLVFGGSAQLSSLPLIAANLPLWTIFFTAAIVNLRFIIFSAAMQPHFGHLPLVRRLMLGYMIGDVNFVLFIQRYPATQLENSPATAEREAYFYGLSCCNWLAWQSASIIGILLAQHIPNAWDVGFAGTLALLAIAIPLFADRAGIAAMSSAAAVSLIGIAWPYRLNLVAAVLTATVVGLLVDRFFSAPKQPKNVGENS